MFLVDTVLWTVILSGSRYTWPEAKIKLLAGDTIHVVKSLVLVSHVNPSDNELGRKDYVTGEANKAAILLDGILNAVGWLMYGFTAYDDKFFFLCSGAVATYGAVLVTGAVLLIIVSSCCARVVTWPQCGTVLSGRTGGFQMRASSSDDLQQDMGTLHLRLQRACSSCHVPGHVRFWLSLMFSQVLRTTYCTADLDKFVYAWPPSPFPWLRPSFPLRASTLCKSIARSVSSTFFFCG